MFNKFFSDCRYMPQLRRYNSPINLCDGAKMVIFCVLYLQGCPKLTKRSEPLAGRSSPYYENMWRRYCCLTSFFPIVDTCLICEDIARRSCAMVPRWRFLATVLRPVFAASRVPHISDLHSKFALRLHHVWKYGRNPLSGC